RGGRGGGERDLSGGQPAGAQHGHEGSDARAECAERLLYTAHGAAVSFEEELANARPNLQRTLIRDGWQCDKANVLKDGQCVPCSPGTFFQDNDCVRCPLGQFQDEWAQLRCKPCPHSTTLTTGATAPGDCKPLCPPGTAFNLSSARCAPCAAGSFQPRPGQFACLPCPPGMTTLNSSATSAAECVADCPPGRELAAEGCRECPRGLFRERGTRPVCVGCPTGFSTVMNGTVDPRECSVPLCGPGSFLDVAGGGCVICPFGFYQPLPEQTGCLQCPEDTTTLRYGATSIDRCVSTNKCANGQVTCHPNAHCFRNGDGFKCLCKPGFRGDGMENCDDMCDDYCFNSGKCSKDSRGQPVCSCPSTFYGERCQSKSEAAYIAGGVAGAVLVTILIILLVWMICVRARNRRCKQSPSQMCHEKAAYPYANDPHGMALYAIEYPPSCSTTATLRSQNVGGHGGVGYFDEMEETHGWDVSGLVGFNGKSLLMTDGQLASIVQSKSAETGGTVTPVEQRERSLYENVQRHTTTRRMHDMPPVPLPARGGEDLRHPEYTARL
ncbi:signal peptide, CUB and EGF-like domain-containing protein 2, partial [Paramacrobiotus metropolitanus]|uniref:signal peptide, CUB and EGF-like domain-containing protein 2 n=1 Tax=Paramacrobiotus metropolitanus TaxID=2943436 RepID=UPI00244620F8